MIADLGLDAGRGSPPAYHRVGVGLGQGSAIGTPGGKFGTFTLVRTETKAEEAGFRFAIPLVFAGIDVNNDADHDATVRVHSPENRGVSVTVKAKQLVRLRTEWQDASPTVWFATSGGEALRFDNLAYLRP